MSVSGTAKVIVRCGPNDGCFVREFGLSELEVARIASNAAGFDDVDVDGDAGSVDITVTATGPNKSVRVHGKSVSEAVAKLLERLHG